MSEWNKAPESDEATVADQILLRLAERRWVPDDDITWLVAYVRRLRRKYI